MILSVERDLDEILDSLGRAIVAMELYLTILPKDSPEYLLISGFTELWNDYIES